jgi:hypothetical protein
VDLLLNDLRARLAERRITLVVTEAALRFIAEQGFDPAYGADRCGVSLPARLRPGSGEHCYAVIFPRAARSLLILGWGTHRGISERSTGRDGSGMSAGGRFDASCDVFELSDQEPRSRRRAWRATLRKVPHTPALGSERVRC